MIVIYELYSNKYIEILVIQGKKGKKQKYIYMYKEILI